MKTPLAWLQRHGEFREGTNSPSEVLPSEYAFWRPVSYSWRDVGIDLDDEPEATVPSQIGPLPFDGGDFLPFLLEYRMTVEGGGITLDDVANRYPQYRRLLFPPPRAPRKKHTQALSISILDYAEIPGSKEQYHFNFEFHCGECGGYLISTPDTENEFVRCTACGIAFDTLAKINDACRTLAINELKARKLGAFRDA